jgi:hypothetical protein
MEKNTNRPSVILGTLLLAAGLFTLLAQVLGQSAGWLWPLIVIGFGLAFFVAMLLGGRSFGGLAVPGSIITGIGLLLLFQSQFDLWETWGYSWALIISLVGIGLVISGAWSGRPDLQRSGWGVAQAGLILFLIFGLIFEFIFSATGLSTRTGGLFWPLVLVLVGLGMIISRSFRLIRGGEDQRADLNLFWPVIFIGAGLLWFQVLQGVRAPADLSVLISLWPVLLVAGGVNLLLGRRLQWINLLLGVAVVAGAFYAIDNSERLGLARRAPWGILGVNFNTSQPVSEWITGSGVMAEEDREVGNFQRVALDGAGELVITQGSRPALTIEAEDNLLPYIITQTGGGLLEIKTKPGIGFSTTRPIRYLLTVVDLEAVSVSGASSIRAASLDGQELRITLNGFGSVNLENLQVETFVVDISGSGSVTASGATRRLEVSISGAGGFQGPDFVSTDAVVQINGLGRATVWATDNLRTEINGMGSVRYFGSPNVIRNVGGIGIVDKAGDK